MEEFQTVSDSRRRWAMALPHPEERVSDLGIVLQNLQNQEILERLNLEQEQQPGQHQESNDTSSIFNVSSGQQRPYIRKLWDRVKLNCKPKYVVHEQLEEAIKFDNKLGLVSTAVTKEGKVFSTKKATVFFVVLILLAAINISKDINWDFYNFSGKNDDHNQTAWFFTIAYQAALFMLVGTVFSLIVWCSGRMGKALMTLRTTTSPQNNMTHLSGRGLRVASLCVAILFAVAGFTVIFYEKQWTLNDSFLQHEWNILHFVVPEHILHSDFCAQTSATPTSPTAIENAMNDSAGFIGGGISMIGADLDALLPNAAFNGTSYSTSKPACDRGLFSPFPFGETLLIGFIGMILCVILELFDSLISDWVLLSTRSIWAYAQDLDVSDLYIKFGKDGPEVSEEELERMRKIARGKLDRFDEVLGATTSMNGMLVIILPAFIVSFTFMMTCFAQIYFYSPWFMFVYFGIKFIKALPSFIYSIKTSMKVDAFQEWFSSSSGKLLLGLDNYEFQMRIEEFNTRSIGVGGGFCRIGAALVASLAAIILSNFFMLSQSMDSQPCICECLH